MTEFTHQDVVEECKLHMISDAEREIWKLVKPVLNKRMAEYKESFGGFSRTDVHLWYGIDIGIEVAIAAAKTLDEYNFDIDDAVDALNTELARARPQERGD